jgi:hypothetical protein
VSDLLKQTASASAGKPTSSPASATAQATQSAQQSQNPAQAKESPASQSAPSITQGANPPSQVAQSPAIDPNAAPKPPAPSIADRETTFSKPDEPKPADPNAPPKAPSAGKLGLPQTTLAAAPNNKDDINKPAETPAQEKLDNALTEQRDLLTEFAKVSDQLAAIVASLEASTFVKRFKAASRQQMSIASTINQKTLDAFGIVRKPAKEAETIAKRATEQSQLVRLIQSDLEAYFQRKQDSRFKTILDQMKKTETVRALAREAEKLTSNLPGQTMAESEFWADTFDRWSEELVAASNCKSCTSCNGESLPPEIVLKVMQALRDEMKLRDETREVENARTVLETDKYREDAEELSSKQESIKVHTRSAAQDILAIPEGARKFGKELQLLNAVVTVMDEAAGILETPETGATAIAAETEAIELLLQAKRMSKGGGGGGSNPGGGGRAATAGSAALADLGPGGDADTTVAVRNVGQATGRAGKEFPAEFKVGLDAYFNLVEDQSAGK